MIRLLIVDEQKSIQESLKFLLAKEKEIKILATASNGKVAVEKVKELHPDVVLMDLSMPIMDGVTATKIISQRYPQTRILVLTNSNKSKSLNQALVAGAKGYLLKTAPIEDIITALHAVHRGCAYFGPHVWQTPTFFSVSSLNSQSQLKSLTNKIAQEIIICWRTQSEQKPVSATDILTLLRLISNRPEQTVSLIFNSQAKDKLLVQLKLQIKKLKVSCQKENGKKITQKLEQIAQQMIQEVEKDFVPDEHHDLTSNYLSDFQVSAHDFRNQTIQRFQKYLSDYWQTTAPKNLLNCLEDLKCILNQLHQQYQNQQKQYLTKSNAAWRAYLYLLEKIERDYSLSKLSKKNYASNDWQAIWNAFYYICEDKVNAKIYGWESELISELLEQTQIYLNNLRQTDDLLNELQEYFEQHHSSLIPISSSYIREKIDSVQLRTSIETLSGHSLNQWGTSAHISAPIIRQHLLAELDPITKSIYTQFYQEAFSVIHTNNLIDDN
jgi:DNA-binding NarL/FixJ family response regulator